MSGPNRQQLERRVIALISAILLATLLPLGGSLAAPGTTPELHVRDAPVTRNRDVEVSFWYGVDPVDRLILANEDVRDEQGHLIGTLFDNVSKWTLAPGPAGPRTIYGQIRYTSGEWSAVLSKQIELVTGSGSSLYTDLDPQSTSTVIRVSPNHQWHEIARTPEEPFGAAAPTTSSVTVWTSFWNIGFSSTAALAPGTYQIGPFDDDGECVGNCASIWTSTNTRCLGTQSGSFTVNSIQFDARGDVLSADIDFRLVCRIDMVMAGTVLYGKERPVLALDQDFDSYAFWQQNIGTQHSKTFTFENIGDAAQLLGTASFGPAVTATALSDYAITADTCSGTSLPAGESCQITVRFTPGGLLARNAVLVMPDRTSRQSREIVLTGGGQQPTSLTLTQTGSTTAPGPITFTMTMTPPTGAFAPRFTLENGPPSHHLQWTVTEHSNPARREYIVSVELTPGTYTARAIFDPQGGYLASTADPVVVEMTGDSTPPVGQIVVDDVVAGFTNNAQARITLPATDNDTGVAKVAWQSWIGGRSSGWLETDYASVAQGIEWWQETDGTYTLFAKWRDVAGNWSETVQAQIILDTVPPDVIEPPAPEFVAGRAIVNGKVTVNVPWEATDETSGIDGYNLNERTNSGSWRAVAVPGVASLTPAESVLRSIEPGRAYTYRLKATDVATNTTAWTLGPKLAIRTLQEANTRIKYGGTWTRVTGSAYWGSAAKKSTKAGATASLTFTGRSVAWVARIGRDRGRAQVYVNNVLVETVDLYSATAGNKRVVWSRNWDRSATRMITIKVLGTAGRPTVELDALLTAE